MLSNSGGGAGSRIGVKVNLIGAISLKGGFPRNDRASLDRFSVTRQRAVTVDGLIRTRGAHASELHPQAVSHSVLLSQTQNLVTGILEVSHARKGDAPGLGCGDRQVETLGFVVIGDDFFRVGIGFQCSVGQTVEAGNLVQAVHVEGGAGNRKDAVSVRDRGTRAEHVSVGGAKVDEGSTGSAGAGGDTSEGGIHIGRSQRHHVNIIAKGR
jgi:hypothetical protein